MEKPYLEKTVITIEKSYNPAYGDDRVCKCGHTYYSHFDNCDNMETSSCKYCGCDTFEEVGHINIDFD